MPARVWPLWLLTVAVLLVLPITEAVYWSQMLDNGLLSPDGDSVAIPIFNSVIGTILVAPILCGFTWLAVRHYNPATRLWAWRRDRLACSAIVSVIALAGLLGFAFILAIELAILAGTPWYSQMRLLNYPLWAFWLMAMRAAWVDQLPANDGALQSTFE